MHSLYLNTYTLVDTWHTCINISIYRCVYVYTYIQCYTYTHKQMHPSIHRSIHKFIHRPTCIRAHIHSDAHLLVHVAAHGFRCYLCRILSWRLMWANTGNRGRGVREERGRRERRRAERKQASRWLLFSIQDRRNGEPPVSEEKHCKWLSRDEISRVPCT